MKTIGIDMLTEKVLVVEDLNGTWRSVPIDSFLGQETQLKQWLQSLIGSADVKDIEVTVSRIIHRPTDKSVRWFASSIEDMFFHYKPYPERIDEGDPAFNNIYNGLMADALK